MQQIPPGEDERWDESHDKRPERYFLADSLSV